MQFSAFSIHRRISRLGERQRLHAALLQRQTFSACPQLDDQSLEALDSLQRLRNLFVGPLDPDRAALDLL